MAEIRILNGNNARLRNLLGDLADKVEVRRGDAVVTCETEDQIAVGRAVFERLITQGHAGFAVREGTGKSKKIEEWDPESNPFVVMVGPLAGG